MNLEATLRGWLARQSNGELNLNGTLKADDYGVTLTLDVPGDQSRQVVLLVKGDSAKPPPPLK